MLKNNDLKIKTMLAGFAFCLTLLLLLFFLHSSTPVSADQSPVNASAGSADDPLITLSYINKVYTPMLSRAIDSAIADSLKAVNDKLKDADSQTLNVPDISGGSNSPDVSGAYIVLELKKGQRVRANSESLEVILRQGGTALVISQYKEQGIADLTSGTELLDGVGLPVNHALLIPRADGRGIYVTSSVAYIMVRGDYEIY